MLRASKTLQPENDTRRLCPMSMNRVVEYPGFANQLVLKKAFFG